MAFAGLLQMAIQVGTDAILVKPKRKVGPFVAQVTIREEHHDSMEITEQPVEQGASVNDHAFKRPAELVLDVAWSTTPNSNAVGSSSSLLGSLAGAVTGTIGGITDIAGQIGNALPASVGQLSDVVTQPLTVARQMVGSTVTDVGQTLSGAVSGLVPDVGSIGSSLTGIADSVISNVPGGLAGGFASADLLGNVKDALSGGLDPASLVGDLADSAASALSDFSGGIDSVSSAQSGEGTGQPKDIYQKFLALQASAAPFDVFTGKRSYTNMLIAEMTTVTDKTTENALFLRLRLRELIIVQSATSSSVAADASDQSAPEETAASADQGDQQLTDAPNYAGPDGEESIDADPSSQPIEAGA